MTRTTIDDLLARARAGLIRVGPQEARAAMRADALLLDIRSESQRAADGVVAGSIWLRETSSSGAATQCRRGTTNASPTSASS